MIVCQIPVYTKDEAKVGNLREWSLTSLAQNTQVYEQLCINEVSSYHSESFQPVANFLKMSNVDDVIFWLPHVRS